MSDTNDYIAVYKKLKDLPIDNEKYVHLNILLTYCDMLHKPIPDIELYSKYSLSKIIELQNEYSKEIWSHKKKYLDDIKNGRIRQPRF